MENKTKMMMTQKLADELMDNLAMLAMSALGTEGHIKSREKNGEEEILIFEDEYVQEVLDYARSKFVEICNEWEQKMGETFVVVHTSDEEMD